METLIGPLRKRIVENRNSEALEVLGHLENSLLKLKDRFNKLKNIS